MSVGSGVEQPRGTSPLPRSIWVVAWASLVGQIVLLVLRGSRSDNEASIVVSVVLGALIVGYVSAGVVRARTVRLVIAWIVLVLSVVGSFLAMFSTDDLGRTVLAGALLVTSVVSLAGLVRFRRSDWYAWQRTGPPKGDGQPIGRLVAVGVLVGVLGGLVAPYDDGVDVRVRVADS